MVQRHLVVLAVAYRVGQQRVGDMRGALGGIVAVYDHEMAGWMAAQIVVDRHPRHIALPGGAVEVGGGQAGQDGAVAL